MKTAQSCESCGREAEPAGPVKTLEDQFAEDARKEKGICIDCFTKRFGITSRERVDTGGVIYELQEKPAPKADLGSSKFGCKKCDWVAWSEKGLEAHMQKRHP
ncbi:MAG: hypothetical protein ACFFD9_05505 [Candidatus Thorarchaeota archaeon]